MELVEEGGAEKMKKKDILLTNLHLRDLNPRVAGWEICHSGYAYGPTVRAYTLLHYVESGKGILYKNGNAYRVGQGEIFCILPDEVASYCADEEDPWVYRWLGFDGALSADFAALPPVFSVSGYAARCFSVEDCEGDAGEYRLTARLFRLYGEIFGAENGRTDYVQQVRDYVEASYMQPLRVEEIAAQLHLNRRYLTRLFHAKTGQTVQDYILSVRMAEATRYLSLGLSVGETAERCGYADPFLFSKMFKRRMGVSPNGWKKGVGEQKKEKNSCKTESAVL